MLGVPVGRRHQEETEAVGLGDYPHRGATGWAMKGSEEHRRPHPAEEQGDLEEHRRPRPAEEQGDSEERAKEQGDSEQHPLAQAG